MLKVNSSVYQIDHELFEDTIGVNGFEVFIDIQKYNLLTVEVNGRFMTAESLLIDIIERVSKYHYHSATPSVVRDILKRIFCMDNLIKTPMTKSGSNVSIDQDKVIKPLRDAALKRIADNPVYYGDIVEFCNLYLDYTKLKSFKSFLESKRKMLIETNEVDNFGNKLYSISSMYEKQSTGRYYTNQDNLQGWNLEAVDTFTAPKDYCFVWADFDQIDLRVAANLVLFNGHPEMIEEFDKTPDKYEAIVRIIYNKMGKPFDFEKFKVNRKAYKRAILARLYGAGIGTMMSAGFTDLEEMHMLNNYYVEHKYYQSYVNSFKEAISFNTEVCIEDYFGATRHIQIQANNSYKSATVLEACLNTPIQSTSNDIVMLWVNELTKSFRELGIGRDKFRVALLRHDEAVFMVHKDCIPHLWLFKKYSSICIDSWSELTIEPEFGFNYKVTNEELNDMYKTSIANNLDKLNYIEEKESKPANKSWNPCKKTLHVRHIAPVNPAEFTYYLLYDDMNWRESVDNLGKLIKEHNNTLAMSYAVDLIHEYQKSPNAYKYILKIIEYYNKYCNVFITDIAPNVYIKIPKSKLIQYLVDNDYGYVYVHNILLNNYVVFSNGIQMKYVKDDNLDNLVERIEEIERKGNDQG